ncbi:MAG: hypothetical protein KDK25_06205 [Leptospiraceae bacterium]|nr:hypothetical protein [Leptospiraceae bacterium]MCB1169906.1 hypothetical protein [Leptospiraceae bacterium]
MSDEQRVMEGAVHLDYQWNPGSTVGEFLTGLRDGELMAGRCNRTGKRFLPPQSRLPTGGRCSALEAVTMEPRWKTGTLVHRAPWNLPEGIVPPYMLGAIEFPDVDNALIHLVVGRVEDLKLLKAGDLLKAVFADRTAGSIRDILYFVPAGNPARKAD